MPERSAMMHASLKELAYVQQWLTGQGITGTVLIGGWAVQAYNPWYGSIDIDLVMAANARETLRRHLFRSRGYTPGGLFDKADGFGLNHGTGRIVIETFNKGHAQPFEGEPAHHLNFDLLDVRGQTVVADLDDVAAHVPSRHLLLAFKLKAAWDRTRRVDEGRSPAPQRERNKVVKDHADILALMDPEHGGREIDLTWMSDLYTRHPFLVGTTRDAYRTRAGVAMYGRDPGEAQDWIDRLLELAGPDEGRPSRTQGGSRARTNDEDRGP